MSNLIDVTWRTPVRLTGPVLPALISAARLGPYFAWSEAPESPDWRPWTDLGQFEVAAERVEAARTALSGMFGMPDLPVRPIASVTFLGYASRIVSPLLGAAVTGGALPMARASEIRWREVPGGPLPIAYAGNDAKPTTGRDVREVAEALAEVAVDGLLTDLIATFRARFRLSAKVLYGNVASALGGAAGMIAGQAPEHTARAAEIVAAMLEIGPLTGTGAMIQPDPRNERHFLVRNNCCLYYRIPGGGTCGDCVLTPADERQRTWAAALQ